jgi:hypothetical protein
MFEFRNTALTVFAVLIANPQRIHSLLTAHQQKAAGTR